MPLGPPPARPALAAEPYDGLEPPELDELAALLEPISEALAAAGSPESARTDRDGRGPMSND